MSIINYAVEITTDATGTDVDYGYVAGVFRFITGRPGYTGDAPYPTWEDTTDNTHRWFEGWLLKDGMGNPNRRVDITRTGNYGTLSGFNFKIKNDGKFWDFLETGNIYLCNRSVRLYSVIDGVFRQIWDGVIANEPYTETDYEFVCVDKFKTIHQEMPPYSVNVTDYPDADRESLGESIPISFGDVQYAKLIKTANKKTIEVLVDKAPYKFESAQSLGYYTKDPHPNLNYEKTLNIVTRGVTFERDELVGKYLMVVAGKGANKSRLIRITGNWATSEAAKGPDYDVLLLGIAEPLDSVTDRAFIDYKYNPVTGSNANSWWFQIVDFTVSCTPSTHGVLEFVRDPVSGLIKLYTYDSDKGIFNEMQDNLFATVIEGGKIVEIQLQATSVNEDGQIEVFSPIPFTTYKDAMYDFDQTTYTESIRDVNPDWAIGVSTKIFPGAGYDYSNVSAIYLGLDFSVQKADIGATPKKFKFRLKWDVYNVYGHKMTDLSDVSDMWWGRVTDATCAATETKYFHLPQEYYRTKPQTLESTHWGDYSETDAGDPQRLGETMRMPGPIADALKAGLVSRIEIFPSFKESTDGSFNTVRFKIYEIGLFSTKYIDTIQGDLYGQISGETSGSTPSSTVYGAFKLMLETYDGIAAADIDYTNLPSVRSDWPVSRQITEKKNSLDYIIELAEQSFVAIAPTRTGKRRLSAWRDNFATVIATHTETSIIRDSIASFAKTEVKDLFNTFNLLYHYNPATKKYERSLSLRNVDQATFPEETSATWKEYAEGVNPNSYRDAQKLWADCSLSYQRSKGKVTAPASISNLNWYTDSATITTGAASPGCSVDDSPWRFLTEIAHWATRQKEIVKYALPMSATNLTLELLDYIQFSDAIYTNNALRPGWVNYIEVDTKKDRIIVEATLNPVDLAEDNTITERGIYLNIDTVEESINQTNAFEEPQQVRFI